LYCVLPHCLLHCVSATAFGAADKAASSSPSAAASSDLQVRNLDTESMCDLGEAAKRSEKQYQASALSHERFFMKVILLQIA
jgi:hypothetical protein